MQAIATNAQIRVQCTAVGVVLCVVGCHDFSLPNASDARPGQEAGTAGHRNHSTSMTDGTAAWPDASQNTPAGGRHGEVGNAGPQPLAGNGHLTVSSANTRDGEGLGGTPQAGNGNSLAGTIAGNTPGTSIGVAGGSGTAVASNTSLSVGGSVGGPSMVVAFAGGTTASAAGVGGTMATGTSGAGVASTAGTTSTDDSDVPPRTSQSVVHLLTGDLAAEDGGQPYGGVGICFYSSPRLDGDGNTWCPRQTSGRVDCAGNAPAQHDLMDLRRRVKLAILDSWQRMSNLEIFDWIDCPINEATGKVHDKGIPLWIAVAFATVDRAQYVGRDYSGPTVLYVDWRKIADHDYSAMLHEFGHVLGYGDDWLRADYQLPTGCSIPKGHPTVGFRNNAFLDHDAIMGACYSRHRQAQLGPGDAALTQWAYGRRMDGALVGYPGQCLVAGGSVTYQFPCRGGRDEVWRWDLNTSALTVETQAEANGPWITRCLNPTGDTLSQLGTAGAELQPCDGRPSESMTFSNTQWRAFGSHCIEATTSGLVNRRCAALASQQWKFMDSDASKALSAHQIQLSGTDQCVSSRELTPHAETVLALAPCDAGDASQAFEYPGAGRIVQGNRCVNLSSSVATEGTPLVLSDACNGEVSPFGAKFHLTTEIRKQEHCLSWATDLMTRALARFEPCAAWGKVPQQSWDYYL